jgi:hypothetical protein
MRRLPIVAAVLIAAGIGIIDPYACVQYGTGGSLQRDISKKERDSLLRTAVRARDLVSSPGTRYEVDRESDEASADTKASWDDPAGMWMAPGTARALRIYYPRDPDAANAPPAFETRIHVNAETGMPRSLATIFGDPRPFRLDGAAAIEIPTVATGDAEPASGGNEAEGGRVAMPATPEAVANSITLLRVLVSAPETEEAFRAASEGKTVSAPRRAPVERADRVESITVEFYGAKKDVERVARGLPMAKLRALLSK